MNMKISRRHFIKKSSIATAALTIIPSAMRAQTMLYRQPILLD